MLPLDQFRKSLGGGIGPGARWYKADFHVHAPSSFDYDYKAADASKQLGEAIDRGRYGFVVVVDHERFPSRSELAAMQSHCPGTTLIPGAEINVFVAALSKKVGKDYFFHCIVAIDPDQPGDYEYLLRRAEEELPRTAGVYPTGFTSNVADVARFFVQRGAIFMPAHLHQGKSPEDSRSIDDIYDDEVFLGLVASKAFHGLEVISPRTAGFFSGEATTSEGSRIPFATCVMSSDAHHHDHIEARKRWTWVRAERRTFPELAAALAFKHRVSLADPVSRHSRVVGMHVVGSFVPDAWVSLNEGFNALIGSKGSGKTALLECLRFVLNAPVPSERIESVQRHLSHVLGPAGYVECLVQDSEGSQRLITRRADSPDRITTQSADGSTATATAKDEMPFPISILGWHEIEAVADKADARIALLDRIGEPAIIRSFYEQIGIHVQRARDELPVLQRDIRRLNEGLKDLWELQRKRATLQRLQEGELSTLQSQYEWFLSGEQALLVLEEDSRKRSETVPSAVSASLVLKVEAPAVPENVKDALERIAVLERALQQQSEVESKSVAALQESLLRISTAATEAVAEVRETFAEFRDRVYMPRVNALDPADRDILTKQIQVLEETKRLPTVERQCDDLLGDVKALAAKLATECERVLEIRANVVKHRQGLVEQVNASVPGVQLTLLRSANHEARTRFQSRYGEEGAGLFNYLQGFGGSGAYENLRALFEKLTTLEREQGRWQVSETLWNVKFVDLLDVADDDDVDIRLAVGNAGFVQMQNLSSGQRSVAVFPLLLRNSRGPLVIDQPEDNLDNRYIADVISPDLLRGKTRQQYLVTSHNANLVVLSDADLIVHVDADGTRASFPSAGFLSCPTSTVKGSVLDVLDGGNEALAARQRKYGQGPGA